MIYKRNKMINKNKQKGAVLIFVLIILGIMILAIAASVRSGDTVNAITTNMGLKQNASYAADAGVETATTWLSSQTTSVLESDSPTNGYYASNQETLNLKTGVDWNNDGSTNIKAKVIGTDANGNKVSYIIHRICNSSGAIDTATCAINTTSTGSSTSSKGGNGTLPLSGVTNIYYRITVKVQGPKNTTTYIQTMLYM